MNFIHLRVQSSYSMLASALKIEQLIDAATQQEFMAIAMTDINNMFGALEFAMTCKKSHIKPIHGLISTILYQNNKYNQFGEILLLAQNDVGYKNLLKLASYPYIKNDRSDKAHITIDDVKHHSDGLIMLSGYNDGPIGQMLLANQYDSAKMLAQEFSQIFGDRFYLEIMRHGLAIQDILEPSFLKLAIELSIPLVATNQVLFETIDMHEAHDILLCIASNEVRDNTNRKTASNQCYLKTAQEMLSLFSDIPTAIENTYNIAIRCSVMAEPHHPMLPNFATQNMTEEELLRQNASDGLKKRLQKKFHMEQSTQEQQKIIEKQYFDRLEYEISVICTMQFAGYFLIVADFIQWSKENDIPVGPGRGSGAGSIVAWSLLITDLDPIRFGLLFERFLNPDRVSMPDFDIDFCQEKRDMVISYVCKKYGNDYVAQIITFGKLQAKSVIKDVSRVIGLKFDIANYITDLVPFNAINPVTLQQAINDVAELKQAYNGNGLYEIKGHEALIKDVLETSLTLEGLHRHVSIHAAGIVIAGTKLNDIVALYKDIADEMTVIQYSMKYAELAGLVKFDFLGLQTLTVISKCCKLLAQRGIKVIIEDLQFDDAKTYKLLSEGKGLGVFQFESAGMKDALKKLKPDCVEDLIALGALYRPGPMENIPAYIACKHKRQEPNYLHPLLENVLRETYGVIIYQEQVMEIAKILGGYSLGAADLLRRAMGKKIKSEMDAQEKLFVSGAVANGVSEKQASEIFAAVAKFAGYGFNKSHAAAYGVISYYTAYLKANYTIEFLISCINLDLNDQDQVNMFIYEAKDLGIGIVPANINLSYSYFTATTANNTSIGHSTNATYEGKEPSTRSIIFGFTGIKNVTASLGDHIVELRQKYGKFTSAVDFVEKVNLKLLNKRAFENLIKAGCFDSLHNSRRALIESIPKLIQHAQSNQKDTASQQISLFSIGNYDIKNNIIDQQDEYDVFAKASFEIDTVGGLISFHPLSSLSEIAAKSDIRTIDDAKNHLPYGNNTIKIMGIILAKDTRMSARGRFVTIRLSDHTNIIEVSIFSENVLKRDAHLLSIKTPVIVVCDVFRDEGGIRATAIRIHDIQDYALDKQNNKLKLQAMNNDELNAIMHILEKACHTNDNSNTSLINVEITTNFEDHFLVTTQFEADLALDINDMTLLEQYIDRSSAIVN